MKIWHKVEEYTSSSVTSTFVKWLQQAAVLDEADARAAQTHVDRFFQTDPQTAPTAREVMRGENGASERLGLIEHKLPPVGSEPVSCMACVMTSPMQVLCCLPCV